MRLRSLLPVAGFALALTLTGCAGLSFQNYGSQLRGHTISEGQTRAAVIANLGEPSSIYSSGGDEVFLYRKHRGKSVFGIYNEVKRDDLVVVFNGEGRVEVATNVEVGKGYTWFSPAFLDGTHPVPSSSLRKDPETFEFSGKLKD